MLIGLHCGNDRCPARRSEHDCVHHVNSLAPEFRDSEHFHNWSHRRMRLFLLGSCLLLYVKLPFVSGVTRLVRVKTETTTFTSYAFDLLKKCGADCRAQSDDNSEGVFCFGFSIRPGENCVLNTAGPKVPEDNGDYYMLTDYRNDVVDGQCRENKNDQNVELIKQDYGATFKSRIFNGSLFLLDSELTTGAQCKQICDAKQMHVTSVHSEIENDFIRGEVCASFEPASQCASTNTYKYICHVGINVYNTGTSWNFTDGSPKDFSNGFSPSYVDWSGVVGACVQMKSDGSWNNCPCDEANKTAHCVCRKSL